MGVILFAEHIMHIVPVGTHEYKKFVALSAAQEMLKESRLRLMGDKYKVNSITFEYLHF